MKKFFDTNPISYANHSACLILFCNPFPA